MPTNEERHELAERMRGGYDVTKYACSCYLDGTIFGLGIYASTEYHLRLGLLRLARMVEP